MTKEEADKVRQLLFSAWSVCANPHTLKLDCECSLCLACGAVTEMLDKQGFLTAEEIQLGYDHPGVNTEEILAAHVGELDGKELLDEEPEEEEKHSLN